MVTRIKSRSVQLSVATASLHRSRDNQHPTCYVILSRAIWEGLLSVTEGVHAC